MIHSRYDRLGNLLAQSSEFIAGTDQGYLKVALGEIGFGGTLGAWNRGTRGVQDPPGPHALTSITDPQFGVRPFDYDANGNLVGYDGWRCTWDAKDRLVRMENAAITAEYVYDFSDRRIIKQLSYLAGSPSAVSPSGTHNSVTLYPTKHFEVRDGVPAKYVWNGETRAVRWIGPLGDRPLVQCLRLHRGWNLVGLEVDLADGLASAGTTASAELRGYLWDPATRGFVEAVGDQSLPAGSILWLHTGETGVWCVKGSVPPENSDALVELGEQGAFHFVPGFRPWLSRAAPGVGAELSTWWFDAAAQRWEVDVGGPVGGVAAEQEHRWKPGQVGFFRGGPAQQLLVRPAIPSREYYHQDHLGSTVAVTDGAGQLLEESAYYPFGETREASADVGAATPYRFAQKEADVESGLQYFEARYLGGGWGRFISPDPMARQVPTAWLLNPQKLNAYVYCENNPLKFRDDDGQEARITIHGNNRITIEVAIKYQGSMATRANIDRANRGIEKYWTGKFGKYQVVTKVVDPDHTSLRASTVTLTDKDTSGKYLRSYVDHESVGDSGRWNPKDSEFTWVAAHEAGHLMGLPDRYTDKDGPMKGWRGNMMAQTWGKVEQRNIDEMLSGSYKYRKTLDLEEHRRQSFEAAQKEMQAQMQAWTSQDLKFDK
jgi:RHS repeat-associated protein